MKILITGATGFVGSKVLTKLSQKYGKDNIIALSSKPIDGIFTIRSLDYKFDRDYLLKNGCEDVEVLFHIGAFTPKSRNDANDIILTTSNIYSTETLLQANLPNLKKIIFISTIDVYTYTELIDETSDTIPATLYGWSKLYCEQMVLKHCEKNGIIYEILRLGHVYGEGEEKYKKVMPTMINNAINGKDIDIFGDGKALRSFIYIYDVVDAIVNSLTLDESQIINIVSSEPISINQLAQLVAGLSDYKIKINHIQTDIKNVNYVFDNKKMKKYLLSNFTPFNVGLSNEYEYMKKI
jgi:nucleoside-diphosphate-sugar epimerase